MEVEGAALFVAEGADIVDMDAAVERAGDQVLDVGVVLDLGDPTSVTLLVDNFHVADMFLVLAWVDRLRFSDEVVLGSLQLVDVLVSELVFFREHFDLLFLQYIPCYILGFFLLVELFQPLGVELFLCLQTVTRVDKLQIAIPTVAERLYLFGCCCFYCLFLENFLCNRGKDLLVWGDGTLTITEVTGAFVGRRRSS